MTTIETHTPVESSAEKASEASVQVFDGVICFGGEGWWYHNRGHFDMQMMVELPDQMRVTV